MKIGAQNRWVIAIYKEANMNTIGNCMNQLSDAMQKFTVRILNDALDSGN